MGSRSSTVPRAPDHADAAALPLDGLVDGAGVSAASLVHQAGDVPAYSGAVPRERGVLALLGGPPAAAG